MKLSASMMRIVTEISRQNLKGNLKLHVRQPLHIARRKNEPQMYRWDCDSGEDMDTVFVLGYSKAAVGLNQRGILTRDSLDPRFWLTEFGIEYIKGLQ